MFRSWRPLALAAAVVFTAGLGVATAQTIIVTNVPAGAKVDVSLADASAGSGTADATGNAKIAANLLTPADGNEVVLDIHLDSCGDAWGVVANVHGFQPPPASVSCIRKEIPGPFVVRHVTTLVIDASDPPTLKIRQGPAPAEWLRHGEAAVPTAFVARRGLSIFGGGGINDFSNAIQQFCGDTSGCNAYSARPAFQGGGVYWFTRFLGAEVSYVRPLAITASGSGSNFSFNSSLQSNFIYATLNGGVRLRRVRIYGQAGGDFHQATSTTTQTVTPSTVTLADGTVETLAGGTQTSGFRTQGWGWLVGAGTEMWFSRAAAIYAQAGYAKVKGHETGGGDGSIDDKAGFVMFGFRVHVFGGDERPHAAATS
jgi:hypothetical protein